jgi:hypothetical protein
MEALLPPLQLPNKGRAENERGAGERAKERERANEPAHLERAKEGAASRQASQHGRTTATAAAVAIAPLNHKAVRQRRRAKAEAMQKSKEGDDGVFFENSNQASAVFLMEKVGNFPQNLSHTVDLSFFFFLMERSQKKKLLPSSKVSVNVHKKSAKFISRPGLGR